MKIGQRVALLAAFLLPWSLLTPTAGALAASAETQIQLPKLEPIECPYPMPKLHAEVEGKTYTCGYMTVPLDRSKADSPPVQIAYQVLKAWAPDPAPDPLLHIEGGPGSSALTTAEIRAQYYDQIRQNRDIILFDIRGAGFSLPRVNCEEYLATSKGRGYQICANAMQKQGYDLHRFNSATNAADAIDLVTALGYDKVNIYGVSYGTRLAQTIMQNYPERLRSATLDSVLPTAVNYYEDLPRALNDTILQVFTDCQADLACNAAYPNLRARFFALAAKLDQQPLQLDDLTELDGKLLAEHLGAVTQELYRLPYLPRLISELEEGRLETYHTLQALRGPAKLTITDVDQLFRAKLAAITAPLSPAASQYYESAMAKLMQANPTAAQIQQWLNGHFMGPEREAMKRFAAAMTTYQRQRLASHYTGAPLFQGGLSLGAYFAVQCNDEAPANSQKRLDANLAKLALEPWLGLNRHLLAAEMATCGQMGITQIYGPEAKDPVTAEVPTLLLSGRYDALTPPAWAEQVAAKLPNHYLVQMNANHGVLGAGPCPLEILTTFVNDPSRLPDRSCITKTEWR